MQRRKLFPLSVLIFPALALGLDSSTEPVIGQGAPVRSTDSPSPEINLVNDVNHNGRPSVGDTVEMTPQVFTDPDGDEVATKYLWELFKENPNDNYDPLQIYTMTPRLTIPDGYEDGYLFVQQYSFTDEAKTDPYEGQFVQGHGGSADPNDNHYVRIDKADEILSLTIDGFVNGKPQVGTTLTVTPTCSGECPAQINYNWQIESAIGSGAFVDIPGATGSTYTPVGGDQRRKIRAIVKS